MSWIDDTVEQFGRGMGLDGLRLADGVAELRFETSGRLFVEQADGAVLVYLLQTVPAWREEVWTRALRLCHYEAAAPLAPSVALHGDDGLVFLIRLPEAEFALPALQRAFEALLQLHRQAAA